MSKVNLRETLAEAPVKKGDRYRVIIARPGQGSSGNYSEELFRRDAEKLIPKGAQAFINHGQRDPEKMVGVYPDGGYFDEAENAVVGDLQVFEHWKAWVAEVFPYVGVSLYAMGSADEEGNVTEILEDPYNGADIVARPGLQGSQIDKLYESAISYSEERPGARQAEHKENKLEKEEFEAALKPLADALATLVAEKKASEAADAQIVADQAAVTSAVEAYDAKVQAIAKAKLPEVQAESLRAAAKAGQDVAPLIESAKALVEQISASLKESAEESAPEGTVLGSRKVESATDLGKVFG